MLDPHPKRRAMMVRGQAMTQEETKHPMESCYIIYPLVIADIAIENGHL